MDTISDRLAEVFNKMNTRFQVDKISKTDHISLTFMEAEVAEINLAMTGIMREEEEILDQGPIIETEEVFHYTVADPEITITQGGHTDKSRIETEVTAAGNKCFRQHFRTGNLRSVNRGNFRNNSRYDRSRIRDRNTQFSSYFKIDHRSGSRSRSNSISGSKKDFDVLDADSKICLNMKHSESHQCEQILQLMDTEKGR